MVPKKQARVEQELTRPKKTKNTNRQVEQKGGE